MGHGSGSQVAELLRRGRGGLLQSWGTAQASRGRADRLRLTNYPTAELTSIQPRKRATERAKHPPHRATPPTKRERTGGTQESHHEGRRSNNPHPLSIGVGGIILYVSTSETSPRTALHTRHFLKKAKMDATTYRL